MKVKRGILMAGVYGNVCLSYLCLFIRLKYSSGLFASLFFKLFYMYAFTVTTFKFLRDVGIKKNIYFTKLLSFATAERSCYSNTNLSICNLNVFFLTNQVRGVETTIWTQTKSLKLASMPKIRFEWESFFNFSLKLNI